MEIKCKHNKNGKFESRNSESFKRKVIEEYLETGMPKQHLLDKYGITYKGAFQGVVIQRKGSGSTATFTVRKMSGAIGMERIFPIASPFIDLIDVNKRGQVNRARIFYLRNLRGKSARIQEKRQVVAAVAK